MIDTEFVRAQLIELEQAQVSDALDLLDATEALERAERTRIEKDEAIARRKREISQKRKELEQAEDIAQGESQAVEVDTRVEKLNAKFEGIAQGRMWYEGIFPHQWQGARFGAVAQRWILADGVGLGKTRTAVGWLDLSEARKVLIVCEANICDQFAGEVMELAPEREIFNLYKKSPKKRHEIIDEILDRSAAVVVVNYEIWRKDKDVLGKLMDWQLDTLIVDEAHNLKSTASANFKYIQSIVFCDNVCGKCRKHVRGLYDAEALRANPSRKVPKPCEHCGWRVGEPTGRVFAKPLDTWLSTKSIKRLCLTTGTPILNEPADIYPLLHLVDPLLFRTKNGFQDTYCRQDVVGKWSFSAGALDNLKPLIRGRFLQRSRDDAGIILPVQEVRLIRVELDKYEYPKQYKAIRQISETAQLILESGQAMTVMHLISLITRKRQANVWPGGIRIVDKNKESETYGEIIFDAGEIDESVKIDAVLEQLQSRHVTGRRQIVFSQFKEPLIELENRIAKLGIRVARFDGDTPKNLREKIKSNFDRKQGEEPIWDVVLANYKTGGTGLNFTAATVTHILDEEWNPGKRDQGYGRTDRIGQTEESEVLIYRIPGSIDTWMSNTIHRKEQIIEGFNETMTGNDPTSTVENLMDAIKSGEML
jgi:SNF2 family DNA or RNA helicase